MRPSIRIAAILAACALMGMCSPQALAQPGFHPGGHPGFQHGNVYSYPHTYWIHNQNPQWVNPSQYIQPAQPPTLYFDPNTGTYFYQ